MSSYRPETSAPRTSSTAATSPPAAVDVLPIISTDPYIPNVLDVITPTRRARDATKLQIPPVFLQSEAVDSSLLLGHGASFVVTRQTLPPGPAWITERKDLGSWTLEKVVKAPERPQYVVYKSARVRFCHDGNPATPQDRRALQSVLTEFHVLLHPPLLQHPNIIDLLGLAWGSHHVEPRHQLPVLVVEYGDLGTLADVQRGAPLSNEVKADLCLGIARGLQELHSHGIIHGDVKPENIIMCSHRQKGMVPKLADFGFAIIEATESTEVMIGGTRTWRAPESYAPIVASRLRLTDVYSFGLVAWSIAIDGKDPFSVVLPDTLKGEDRLQEIDQLKRTNQVVRLSKLQDWVLSWTFHSRLGELMPKLPSQAALLFRQPGGSAFLAELQMVFSPLQQRSSILPQGVPADLQKLMDETKTTLYTDLKRQHLFKDLDLIFSRTLDINPDNRDLSAVIEVLEADKGTGMNIKLQDLNLEESSNDKPNDTVKYHVTNTSSSTRHFTMRPIQAVKPAMPSPRRNFNDRSKNIDWSDLGFKHHWYSWQTVRDLEPRVQTFAVNTLLQLNDPTRQFSLTAFFINGYGVPINEEKGLKFITAAAKIGHGISQAYLWRMFKTCAKEPPASIPILEYLKDQALRGSRTALQDLKELDAAEAAHLRQRLRFGYAGVGATWYCDAQWLFDITQSTLMGADFLPESLGPRESLPGIKVNRRGDYLIHAAAAVGAFGLLRLLVKDYQFDINQTNEQGETPLLCACRSGHPNSVQFLLDNGALASIQSANGETPLHWLISFDETIDPRAIGKDLIQRGGAQVDAFTTSRISHSAFKATLDVDFQMPGTPLMWAAHNNRPRIVSFLLSVGADPNWQFGKGELSPLGWSAYYHYTECLKLMIEHLERTANVPMTTEGKRDLRHSVTYGPLVKYALHASDKFSMVIRNGPGYLTNLRSTLALLQERTKLVRFNLGQLEQRPLHYAAWEAHDEACKVILELDWFTEEINRPTGPGKRTALHESVRWNRYDLFHLLLSHGADIQVPCASPFSDCEEHNWSALHLLADQAHNDDVSIVDDIIAAGLPVDGDPTSQAETPFHIAIRRNAFHLAEKLRSHAANPDILRTQSALFIAKQPVTILGHEIARNARYGLPALRYLLGLDPRPSFVIEPSLCLTALHLVAMLPEGLSYVGGAEITRADFDWETNRAIANELLVWFRETGELDARCYDGKTALHLAAEHGNVGVAEELVRAGASRDLKCDAGETPAEVARRVWAGDCHAEQLRTLLVWLE